MQIALETERAPRATVAAVVVGSSVALLMLFVGPILVGAYVDTLKLTVQEAGMLLSAEMAGFTLGAAAMFLLLQRPLRPIVVLAVALMTLGNASSCVATTAVQLGACRMITGLGAGMIMTATMLVVGALKNADAVFGVWTIGQLLLGALGLAFFPGVIEQHGLWPVFAVAAALSLALLLTVQSYPVAVPAPAGAAESSRSGSNAGRLALCLAGILIYYAAQTAVWAFLERVGQAWGLSAGAIGQTLFASLFLGILGSAIAIFAGARVSRTLAIGASLLISAASCALLLTPSGLTGFVVAAGLFNLGWYLFLPYSSALVASLDVSGRFLVALGVVFPLSLALGPFVGGMLIEGDDLSRVAVAGIVSALIGIVAMLPALRSGR